MRYATIDDAIRLMKSLGKLFLSPTLLHPLGSSSALGTFSHGLIFAPT